VDQLQQLLVQFGPDSEQLKSYFKHHKVSVVVMGIFCSNGNGDDNSWLGLGFGCYIDELMFDIAIINLLNTSF